MTDKFLSKTYYIFLILIFLLVATIIGIVYFWDQDISRLENDQKDQEAAFILKLEEENNLRSQLDNIIEKYENSRFEIDHLNQDLDSREDDIVKLKSEIRNLLNVTKDLDLAKKKIKDLQDISKRYFAQVDSLLGKTEELHSENQNLIAQNIKIINERNQETEEKERYIKQKEELEEVVKLGSILELKNMDISKIKFGTQGQEKSARKAKNIQILRFCCSVSSNVIAKSENKRIFLQYVNPKGEILYSSKSPSNSFFYSEDSSLIKATAFQDFLYEKSGVDILCIDWERGDMLIKGEYRVIAYIDGREVGSMLFSLN